MHTVQYQYSPRRHRVTVRRRSVRICIDFGFADLRFISDHEKDLTMANGVLTEQVVVTVTDIVEKEHTTSWMILWLGYVVASIACVVQAWRDKRKNDTSSASDVEQASPNNREGHDNSSGDITRSMVSTFIS
jgi:hypothetical protein